MSDTYRHSDQWILIQTPNHQNTKLNQLDSRYILRDFSLFHIDNFTVAMQGEKKTLGTQ